MENIKIREFERKTLQRSNELELYKDSFVIVPYMVSGYIDVTNRGVATHQVNPDDFETFKRVWTGNDAVIITWKDSITFNQDPTTKNKDFRVNYHLGEVLLGRLETHDDNVEINSDVSFSQYKSQQNVDSLTFRIDTYFTFSQKYYYYFYKFPEISKSMIYRVDKVEKDFIGNKLVAYVVTFKSLNQDIANTGTAKQQNIMPSAPGQGYLECIVEDATWPKRLGEAEFNKLQEGLDYYKFFDRYITTDLQKRLNRPVYKVVVKQFGASIPASVCFFGRKVLAGDDFRKFRSPSVIFPINLTSPSTTNFYNTQQNETNFYFGEFLPQLLFWKDWKEAIGGIFNATNDFKYEGELSFNYDDLKSTNDSSTTVDNAHYPNELYGVTTKDSSGAWNRTPWQFQMPLKVYDTTNSAGCEANYTVVNDKRAIHDHLFDSYWIQKTMKSMPLTTKNSLNFGNSLMSILTSGDFSMFNVFKLCVIGIGWASQKFLNKKNYQTYRGLVPCSLIDLNRKQTGKDMVYMNVFNSSKDSPASLFFNNATMNVAYQADLTDTFKPNDDNVIPELLTTLNIGQTTDENGKPITKNGKPYLLHGGTELVDNGDGFIIDQILIQSFSKGDISVEFLDRNNEVIWTGIYQSEGKWTDSFREIWTIKQTSVFGRENVFYSDVQPYPAPIPVINAEDKPKELPNFGMTLNMWHTTLQWDGGYYGFYPFPPKPQTIYDSPAFDSESDKWKQWCFFPDGNYSNPPCGFQGTSSPLFIYGDAKESFITSDYKFKEYVDFDPQNITKLGDVYSSFEDFIAHYKQITFRNVGTISWNNIWVNIALGPANTKINDVPYKEIECWSGSIEFPPNVSLDTWYTYTLPAGTTRTTFAEEWGSTNYVRASGGIDFDKVSVKFTLSNDGWIQIQFRVFLADGGNLVIISPQRSAIEISGSPHFGKTGGSLSMGEYISWEMYPTEQA